MSESEIDLHAALRDCGTKADQLFQLLKHFLKLRAEHVHLISCLASHPRLICANKVAAEGDQASSTFRSDYAGRVHSLEFVKKEEPNSRVFTSFT